jgi:hypothetical protein
MNIGAGQAKLLRPETADFVIKNSHNGMEILENQVREIL